MTGKDSTFACDMTAIAPAWIAIPGLVVVKAIVLFLADRRIRRMEIGYGSE